MSIIKKGFFLPVLVFAQILVFAFVGFSQDLEVDLTVSTDSPEVIQVKGKLLNQSNVKPSKNWTFIRSLAGVENLGERVSDLELADEQGKDVEFKKFIAGEYLAENEAKSWSYKINLPLTQNFTSKAHISWLDDEQGILMLGDLLPQFQTKNGQKISARIKFEVPKDWKIISSEKSLRENTFGVEDVEKAVFLFGKNWRENKTSVDNSEFNIATFGDWKFLDAESVEILSEILKSYTNIFGAVPNQKIQIALIPISNKIGRWEAETRGNTLTIVSGDMPFKTRSLQRLHEQLRHELFHLWIPNNLALTGNYDWFYEGFAVYQSLRTAVIMNQIRFEDFLDTLGRAYYLANFNEEQVSLVQSSKSRQSGTNSQVYSKGMIVAFLCDSAILQKSRGKDSIEEIFRQVYQKHRLPNKLEDGNEAILSILKVREELRPIVEKYVEGAEKIVWTKYLGSFGIEASETDFEVRLKVKKKLNGRQKDLLDELGYNNWRKISRK